MAKLLDKKTLKALKDILSEHDVEHDLPDQVLSDLYAENADDDGIEPDAWVEAVKEAANTSDDDDETDTDTPRPIVKGKQSGAIVNSLGGKSVSAVTRDAIAVELAGKLDKSDEVKADLQEAIDVDETRKLNPARLALHLRRTLSKDEVSSLPEPHSKMPTDDAAKREAMRLNRRFDIRPGKPGEASSFYRDMFLTMALGKSFKDKLDMLDAEKDKLPREQYEADWDLYDGRIKNGIKALRSAVDLIIILTALNETLLRVKLRTYDHEGKQQVVRQVACVEVAYKEKDAESGDEAWIRKYMSVSNIKNVKLADVTSKTTAKEQWDACSPSRKPRGPATAVSVVTGVGILSALGDIAAIFATDKDERDEYEKLLTGAGSDQRLRELNTVLRRLSVIAARPAIAARLRQLEDDGDATVKLDQAAA